MYTTTLTTLQMSSSKSELVGSDRAYDEALSSQMEKLELGRADVILEAAIL